MKTIKINPFFVVIIALFVYSFQTFFSELQQDDLREELNQYTLKSENSFYTTAMIEPYIDKFIADAESYDYDCSRLKKIDSIFWLYSDDWQGVTNFYVEEDTLRGYIYLNSGLLEENDTTGIQFVLYHEIGHWLGLEHGEGIMLEGYSSRMADDVRENWDLLVKHHFLKLKVAQIKKDRN